MAAQTLTLSEQISTLSGKKRRGKRMKNVLNIPTNIKVTPQVVGENDAKKLREILMRLLSAAKLPNLQSQTFKKDEEGTVKESGNSKLMREAKNKRDQLSLGVNALSRDIKKKLISAAVIADDVHPRLFTTHLNFLCNNNAIPFVYMPGLREITQNSLGFPCIAVGFKKNFSNFLEAVKKIDTLKINKPKIAPKEMKESEFSGKKLDCAKKSMPSEKLSFTYLYRNSTDKRVFTPSKSGTTTILPKLELDFIPVKKGSVSEKGQNHSAQLGISSNLIKKENKKNTRIDFQDFNESGTDEEEEYYVPKMEKKIKKDWTIDTVGGTENFEYSPASIIKMYSNPNRPKKK